MPSEPTWPSRREVAASLGTPLQIAAWVGCFAVLVIGLVLVGDGHGAVETCGRALVIVSVAVGVGPVAWWRRRTRRG